MVYAEDILTVESMPAPVETVFQLCAPEKINISGPIKEIIQTFIAQGTG